MLGITPLVSISERRLGLITNSSIPLDLAKEVLESSTSRRVRPMCSRKSRNFLPADNTCVLRPLDCSLLFRYRSDINSPQLEQESSNHSRRKIIRLVAMPFKLPPSLPLRMLAWLNKTFIAGENKTSWAGVTPLPCRIGLSPHLSFL